MEKLCVLENINKKFSTKEVFKDLNITINKGELVAITGKSGCGKTTLLNIIGLIEKSDSGSIMLFGDDVTNINGLKLNKLLRNNIAYLFQNYALIDNETIGDNLDLPLIYSKMSNNEKLTMKIEALKKVGLTNPLNQKIYELSGGEQQRVALARIFLKSCDLILADEPTGSLDSENRDEIISILKKLNKEKEKTIVIVTHDPYVAKNYNRIIEL